MDESRIRLLSVALVAACIGFMAWAMVRGPMSTDGVLPTESAPTIRNGDRVIGREDAPIRLFIYTDLECKYCKSMHQRTMPTLRREYGESISFVYRHYPLPSRPKAYPEAIAAECARQLGGNDIFWKYVDRIYEITPSDNGLDLALLGDVADEIGLDGTSFRSCRNGGDAERSVQLDILEGAALGVRITPSTLIVHKSGKSVLVSGDYPNRLRSAINALRATQ